MAVFASEQLFCPENIAAKQYQRVLLLLRSRIGERPVQNKNKFPFILNGLIKYDCIPVEYNTPRFTFSNFVEYTKAIFLSQLDTDF